MTEKVFAFKQALGNYPTGVTVVTALNSCQRTDWLNR